MDYTNSPLETSQLIALLKLRGLSVVNETEAEIFLDNVSYFRLAAYMRPMEIDDCHRFKPGATFKNAVALYEFDAKLRVLLFEAIQTLEVSVRAKIINRFSLAHGAFWFADPTLANDIHKFSDNLAVLERELQRSKDDFIKDHYAKYDKSGYPPAWKLLELVSFGTLTKLFFNFNDTLLKKKIARSYGVPQHEILESWMKSVNALRNSCAHHARVWNRIMPVMPQLPSRLSSSWISDIPRRANRFYSVFCCLVYWLNAVEPENKLVEDFKLLLNAYPNVDTISMGFPSDWQREAMWCV